MYCVYIKVYIILAGISRKKKFETIFKNLEIENSRRENLEEKKISRFLDLVKKSRDFNTSLNKKNLEIGKSRLVYYEVMVSRG